MVGSLVRAHRRRLAMTQEELAAEAGLSARTVRDIETGRIANPRSDTLRLLAGVFRLSTADRADFFESAVAATVVETVAPAVVSRPVPAQLPADVRGFTGRTAELERLDAQLSDPAMALMTITGTAGVGKTALAVHWAHQVSDRFPDGQLYANLRGFHPDWVVEPADTIRDFLDALGVEAGQIPSTVDAQATLYRTLLAGKRMLVLLDNARDAEHVRLLLPGTPTAVVVVTSRNRLAALTATAGAAPVPLDPLSPDAAHGLLTGRLMAAPRYSAEPAPRYGAEPAPRYGAEPARNDEQAAIAGILSACGGLPLALTIAAARANSAGAPLAQLAAELDVAGNPLDVLDGGDELSRVRSVLSWSYAALDPAAARLFRLLGLHPGPEVSVDAVARLAVLPRAGARALLDRLAGANMVSEPAPARFALHDLLREYAKELCEEQEAATDRAAALGRMFDYYVQVAHRGEKALDPGRDLPLALTPDPTVPTPADVPGFLRWFGTELPVLMATIRLADSTGFDRQAVQLAWSMATYLRRKARSAEQATVSRIGVEAAERIGEPAAIGSGYLWLAHSEMYAGNYAEALTHYQRALASFQQTGNLVQQGHVQHGLAYLWEQRQQPASALSHSEKAAELFRAGGYAIGEAHMVNVSAWCHTLLGEHEQALEVGQRALAKFAELGDADGQAATLDTIASAQAALGRPGAAAGHFRQAVDLLRQIGDERNETGVLINLGDALAADGDRDGAREAYAQALLLLTTHANPTADAVRAKLTALKS